MLPSLPMHGGDRNRTSPFAFTGNKFEFRALGSSMSLALPNTVLNTIVAEAIDAARRRARAASRATASRSRRPCSASSRTPGPGHKRIVFDGDNYSDEWHAEAEQRGLANLRQTPDALPWLVEPSTVEVFSKYEVLSERELESRYEVLRRAVRDDDQHRGRDGGVDRPHDAAAGGGPVGRPRSGPADSGAGVGKPDRRSSAALIDEFVDAIFALEAANRDHPEDDEILDEAKYVQSDGASRRWQAARDVADQLEKIVPDDLWPLPKYSEILFIK